MQIRELEIPDVKILTPVQHRDNRGFFSEIYNRQTLLAAGIALDFVQENYSLSADVNTVRGLHFQTGEFQQDKLVQVLQGTILDVAVDLRENSPWYGQHVCAEISAENWQQILVPKGFAHGFVTLQANTAVMYRVTAHYSAAHDAGIRWNDPDLAVNWPISESEAVLSAKDLALPFLADCDTLFHYESA